VKRIRLRILILLSFLWFLVLPFPFEVGWRILGGYQLIKIALPLRNGFQHEEELSNTFYKSHWYLLVYLLAAAALGIISSKLLKHFIAKNT
jgi:hypothetical protein